MRRWFNWELRLMTEAMVASDLAHLYRTAKRLAAEDFGPLDESEPRTLIGLP